jgi:hypothetical protein
MKAKEMSARYIASEDKISTIVDLASACVMEVKTLSATRHANSPESLKAILREIDDKWRAFARLCPDVLPDAFKIAMHTIVPDSKLFLP